MKQAATAAAGVAALCAAILSGCTTTPPANVGTTYECDRGTRLQVSYLRESALVRINGARIISMKQTPSNAGETYEKGGIRLARNGNTAMWNTGARIAPETCKVINTIN